MNKDEVIAILRKNEAELRRRGIAHAGVFGSVARGEADEKNDIDIAVTLDSKKIGQMTIYDAGIKLYVVGLLKGNADVVNRENLRPYIKESVERDLIDAF